MLIYNSQSDYTALVLSINKIQSGHCGHRIQMGWPGLHPHLRVCISQGCAYLYSFRLLCFCLECPPLKCTHAHFLTHQISLKVLASDRPPQPVCLK